MSDTKLNKHGLERFWDRVVAYISNAHVMIGDTPMGTVATTITGAIAEIVDALGNTTMGTTARTLTGAIKEHNDKIGNTTMGTTATTLTGAIAEHEGDISSLNSNLAESYGTGTIDTTYATESSCGWVKKNGMVCIPIGLHLKNITTFQTRKIGQGFPPSNGVSYCVSHIFKNDAPFLGTMQVNASGDLEIVTRGSSLSSSADTVSGQLMYVAK